MQCALKVEKGKPPTSSSSLLSSWSLALQHSVSYFAEAPLRHHNRSAVHHIVYNCAAKVRTHLACMPPIMHVQVWFVSPVAAHATYTVLASCKSTLSPEEFVSVPRCCPLESIEVSADVLQGDGKTEMLRRATEAAGGTWRDAPHLSEHELAELVRLDGVQILVELTGHTANNRLGVCALRPAPVQV